MEWGPSFSTEADDLSLLLGNTDVLRNVPRAAAFEELDWEETGLAHAGPHTGENESIRVAARFRPFTEAELKSGQNPCVRYEEDGRTCCYLEPHSTIPQRTFTFNNVFQPEVQQEDVYKSVAQPIVQGVIDGYNGAILAYGQTGSGKTHTMLGPAGAEALITGGELDWNDVGVIPRAVQELLDYASKSEGHVLLRTSYIEIYQEHIIDLLKPMKEQAAGTKKPSTIGPSPMQSELVRESQDTLVLPEVTEMPLATLSDAMNIMRQGNLNRHQASTQMNRNSSRSHAIFVVTVTNTLDPSKQKFAQLYLVDLAGSERVDKTGVQGMRLEEAKKINLGLLALGQVIYALAQKRKHIPHRDSKLTHLLRNCLGGNARTLVLLSVSPHASNGSETLSVLRFGNRASLVQNVAKVNVAEDAWMLKKMLQRARADLNELRSHCRVLQTQVAAYKLGGISRFSDCSTTASTPPQSSKRQDKEIQLGPLQNFTERRLLVWGLLPSLVCPLSRTVFREPVNAADGWTYERSFIVDHFARAGRNLPRSPVTGQLMQSRLLTPCHVVAALVKMHFPEVSNRKTIPQISKINVWLVREIISYLDGRSLARMEMTWGFWYSASNKATAWKTRFIADFPSKVDLAGGSSDEEIEDNCGSSTSTDSASSSKDSSGLDLVAMRWRRRYAKAVRQSDDKRIRTSHQPTTSGLVLRKK
mmetsp:Transcript_99380/g.207022  ORF Transcript_99380/g.207022 Transcript_99380/m.207022 type:complete len:700 (+) Transcript_99380:104-2203(+)